MHEVVVGGLCDADAVYLHAACMTEEVDVARELATAVPVIKVR